MLAFNKSAASLAPRPGRWKDSTDIKPPQNISLQSVSLVTDGSGNLLLSREHWTGYRGTSRITPAPPHRLAEEMIRYVDNPTWSCRKYSCGSTMRHEEINFHSSVPSRLTLSPFRSHASRSEGNISGNQERDDSFELEGRIPRCALLCCSPNKPVIQEEIEKSLFSSALNASSRCNTVCPQDDQTVLPRRKEECKQRGCFWLRKTWPGWHSPSSYSYNGAKISDPVGEEHKYRTR